MLNRSGFLIGQQVGYLIDDGADDGMVTLLIDYNYGYANDDLDIWGQKSIFCLVIAIFVDGTNDHYTRGYNFPIGTTPKKFSVSELGVIFWGSPLFLAVFGRFWPFPL